MDLSVNIISLYMSDGQDKEQSRKLTVKLIIKIIVTTYNAHVIQ